MRWLLVFLMLATTARAQQSPDPVPATGIVTGRVLDHAGQPVINASVEWTTWNGCMLGEDGGTTTDARGRFVLQEVPIEVDRLSIGRADVRRSDEARVEVRGGETVCVEVRLEPYASLEVTFDRAGVTADVALMGVLEPGRWVSGIRLYGGRWVSDWLGEGRSVVYGAWPGRQHLYVAIRRRTSSRAGRRRRSTSGRERTASRCRSRGSPSSRAGSWIPWDGRSQAPTCGRCPAIRVAPASTTTAASSPTS